MKKLKLNNNTCSNFLEEYKKQSKNIEKNDEVLKEILNKYKKSICGYIRTASKTDSKELIEEQKNVIKKFCNENNINDYELYIDNGFSGLNMNRPGLKQIIKSKNNVMLICKSSVYSRNLEEFNRISDKTGKIVVSINDNIIIM